MTSSMSFNDHYELHCYDLAKIAQESYSVEERDILLEFLNKYLDWLIHRSKPEQLDPKQSASLDACSAVNRLLKDRVCQESVWKWLEGLIHDVRLLNKQQLTLLVGIFSPIFEGPIDWHDQSEMFAIDRLMRCLESESTRWVVLEAYADVFSDSNQFKNDFGRYLQWCHDSSQIAPNITIEQIEELTKEWFN